MSYYQLCRFMASWMTLFCFVDKGHGFEWTNYVRLDRQGNYYVYWKPEKEFVTFKTVVATRGYIGFGLSPNGGMQGSDIIVGWIRNEQVYFYDCYADGNSQPKLDDHQDWELLDGQENDTHTTLTFRRKLITCDSEDFPISDDTSRVIFSYHDDDPESFADIQYHGKNRGSRSTMLLQSKTGQDIVKDNVKIWDIQSPNYNITGDSDSVYWCTIHKAPHLKKKHHVIKIEALLKEGNEAYVHHIVLYQCIGRKKQGEQYLNYPGHRCYDRGMPNFFHHCGALYAAWGIGGEAIIMPNEAGLPLGGDGDEPYFMLQMHYDNPFLNSGIIDNSGLRLYYTPDLREHDAMTLMVGATISQFVIIPPRQKDFIIAGHGHPHCLGSAMPEQGIKVIAVFLHAHLLGRKLITHHFRNDTELPPIAVDNNYDFNYQGYRFLSNPVTVLPGDQLTVECSYDTTARAVTTFGGFTTKEEMCIAFILYYPRIARAGSLSGPSEQMIMALTGITEFYPSTLTIHLPLNFQNHSYMEHLMLYPWTPRYVAIAENVMRYSPHTTLCISTNNFIIEMPYLVSYPSVRFPYEKEDKCDLQPVTPPTPQHSIKISHTNSWIDEERMTTCDKCSIQINQQPLLLFMSVIIILRSF